MNESPILTDDDSSILPSERTLRGRTTPRGERLRAGDVLLGRYTVLSELGEGGMGVVYRCLDSVGGIEVALKCLPPELSRNEAEMEGIRENYALVARLHHSAISGLRNLEKDPDFGEYYLVMDLAEGEDLSVLLRRRHGAPMPLPDALSILRPLAAALDYAHGEKVLHRDVKPGNVKVLPAAEPGGAPRVQLLDFGLAAEVRSSLSRVSRKGHLGSSGTPSYMAPEQWEARPQGPATDQYALAVMAYQMLAGHLPFEADDPDILRLAVLSRAPDPVLGLSRGVNAVLLRALDKVPSARFPSCAAFVEAIQTGRGASSKRPRSAIAITILVVAGTLGMLLFLSSRTGESRPNDEGSPVAQFVELGNRNEAVVRAEPEHVAQTEPEHVAQTEPEQVAQTEPEQVVRAEPESVAMVAARRKEKAESLRKAMDVALRKAEEAAKKDRHSAGEFCSVSIGSQSIALHWCPPGVLKGTIQFDSENRMTAIPDIVLTSGFWMGETEVTQGLWMEVMGYNPSKNKAGYNYPVENVSWEDCQAFLERLNERAPVGWRFSLPTEGQWEYACRARSFGAYGGTGLLDEMGWYDLNAKGRTHPVKERNANAWRLYDMHGNVWEWCADWYGPYPDGGLINSTGPASGGIRVIRGGSFQNDAQCCRASFRYGDFPNRGHESYGLRILGERDED